MNKQLQASQPLPIEKITQSLLAELESRGYKGRLVSIRHLRELEEEIKARHNEGDLDDTFYQERLTHFVFNPPQELPGAQSIIVVAVPRPQTQAVFNWNGQQLMLILPPTYTGYAGTDQGLRHLLAELLAPQGYRVAPARLPLKLLAVRSGLGAYGRNNICYVAGMGSFLQLAAFYSDLPCSEDGWQEAQMMELCRTCRACLHRCPTGAITEERFLLHAERCLAFHNERPAQIPFPAWIDVSWHDCLEGCMHCQRTCPESRRFLNWIEGTEEFSEDETFMLLEGASLDSISTETTAKLERLDLLGDLNILSRNLGVFFA